MILSRLYPHKLPFFPLLIWVMMMGTVTVSAQETFQEKLNQLGFDKASCIDWSDSTDITIPKPTCAYVNLTSITALPKKESTIHSIWMEVYDGSGNYFKKRIQLKIQGNSTIKYEKKSFKVDFFNDEWVGDDTPDIKIGDWVSQDEFHFKAFYLDFFRGTGIMGYKIYDQITSDRGEFGRIWERADIKNPSKDALCHPDAFPCAVYLSGKFYGVYCWQLRKHRKNMNMKKHNAEHVYFDASTLANSGFFKGTLDWSRIELRNPKDLYTMKGKLHDNDKPEELIDETSPYYDLASDTEEVKEYKQMSATVKQYLVNLSKYGSEIQALIDQKKSTAVIRAAIEERFDVTSLIDYVIHNMLTSNFDGLLQNFQWFTYDGKKWFVAPYDLDTTFGYFAKNFIIMPAQYYYIFPVSKMSFVNYPPMKWVDKYFKNEINARYAHLRDTGLLNAETLNSFFLNWYYAVGESNYANEWKKWPNSPCLKETIANPGWNLITYSYSRYNATADYNDTVTYKAGDICRAEIRLWKANKTVKGVRPYKQVGCKDSLQRIAQWVSQRMVSLDSWMNYSFTPQFTSYTLTISSVGWSTLCLPFKFDVPEGIEVYSVTGSTMDGKLSIKRVEEPQAYTPYLVKGCPGEHVFVGMSEQADEDDDNYLVDGCMHGCLVARYVPQGCYVLQNHNGKAAFYRVAENGQVKMGNNRAYLELTNTPSTNIIVFDEETPTCVSLPEKNVEITGIYNMNGVQVEHLVKGVNIIRYSNGKTRKIVNN